MNGYYNPVHIIQGPGSAAQLPKILKDMQLPNRRVLLLAWGKAVFQDPFFSDFIGGDENFEICPKVFEASNPTVEQLFKIYRETEAFAPAAVVAIGGGSIMDVGKSLCCLYKKNIDDEDGLRAAIKESGSMKPSAKWIGIPTTSGTGSETTCWATIWDPSRDAKLSMENHDNYAYAAIVDPEMAKGMPAKLAVSSALDAAAHAVESYWARETNCVSRALALEAIEIIMTHMEALISGEESAHDAMAKGSMLAGLAFSNTKTTACHSISYPLTMHYHIPHGTAVSMLLAPVMRMNMKSQNMAPLLKALGVRNADELQDKISSFLKRSGQPASLEAWGVGREDLDQLASLGITKGRADNNPVQLTPAHVKDILEEIYTAGQAEQIA